MREEKDQQAVPIDRMRLFDVLRALTDVSRPSETCFQSNESERAFSLGITPVCFASSSSFLLDHDVFIAKRKSRKEIHLDVPLYY